MKITNINTNDFEYNQHLEGDCEKYCKFCKMEQEECFKKVKKNIKPKPKNEG